MTDHMAWVQYGDHYLEVESSYMPKDTFNDILVIYFATNRKKENVIVGWYKHATVHSKLCRITFKDSESSPFRYDGNRYMLDYKIITDYENCVLLPEETRSLWESPYSRNESYGYGFGQSNEWFTSEEAITDSIKSIVKRIDSYNGENWIDKYPE